MKISSKVDREQAEKLAKKLKTGDGFDLNDFWSSKQMRNMGGMASLMGKLPGMGQLPDNVKSQMDDKVLVRMEAIINSMTRKEREKPDHQRFAQARMRIWHEEGRHGQNDAWHERMRFPAAKATQPEPEK